MKKHTKIILEIIIIALALAFLEYQVLIINKNIIPIIIFLLVVCVSINLITKLIKDISIKKDGIIKLLFRIFFLILNILLLYSFIYPYFINKNGNIILEYIASFGTGILTGYLLVATIKKLLDIKNDKGSKFLNVKNALYNLIFFCFLIVAILIDMY